MYTTSKEEWPHKLFSSRPGAEWKVPKSVCLVFSFVATKLLYVLSDCSIRVSPSSGTCMVFFFTVLPMQPSCSTIKFSKIKFQIFSLGMTKGIKIPKLYDSPKFKENMSSRWAGIKNR